LSIVRRQKSYPVTESQCFNPEIWISTVIIENFQKSFETGKVLRLLGAKQGRRVSPASLRRVDLLAEAVEEMLKPQLSYRILELSQIDGSRIQLVDGTCFKSPKLARALAHARAVCCFMATVGPAVDAEIRCLMQRCRYADAYVLDAIGSTSAENVVEQFYQRMAQRQKNRNAGVTLRFSPGYCDWPIQQQRPLFKLFDDMDTPDVALNERCLMSPRKSVSGLFGLLHAGVNGADPAYNPCDTCSKRDCIARRSN
jgi:hypothetical protein